MMRTIHAEQSAEDSRIGPEPGATSRFGEHFFTASAFVAATDGVAPGQLTCTVTRHYPNSQERMATNDQRIDLLLPERFAAGRRYRVAYLLSACGGFDADALKIVGELNLHNQHDVICVLPEMGGWYADHPTDLTRRSQSYLREVVVPLVESRYPTVAGKEGRLLLGFSKSGWGAFSLIFCNPEFFGYAAAWDAPYNWDPDSDSMPSLCRRHYAGLDNYRHHHPKLAATRAAEHFKDRTRLVDFEGPFWSKHAKPFSDHLDQLGIKHVFSDRYRPKHAWDAEWVGPMFDALLKLAKQAPVAADHGTTKDAP
jgi:S-formylglutathione hydrolase FrmB